MSAWLAVVLAPLLGAAVAPILRLLIARYSVPPGEPWRTRCARCSRPFPALGRCVAAALRTGRVRCEWCGDRIGPRPAVVEVSAAAVFVLLAANVDGVMTLLACWWIAAAGLVLWHVDLAVQRLPDQLTVAAFAGGSVLLCLAALVAGEPLVAGRVIGGGLALAGGYLLLFLAHPAGIGLGDVKLGLSLGAVLGWYGWMNVLLGATVAFILGGLASAVLLTLKRVGRKDSLPHGPFMLLAAFVLVIFAN